MRAMFQMKENDKTSAKKNKKPNETEIGNLPDKEFKAMVIQILTKLGRMNEYSENFRKTKT